MAVGHNLTVGHETYKCSINEGGIEYSVYTSPSLGGMYWNFQMERGIFTDSDVSLSKF